MVFIPSRQFSMPLLGANPALSSYPQTDDEWHDRYDRLLACYTGEAYSVGEVRAAHLFRALDDTGNEIAQTKRLFRAFAHIVDTDVAGVLSGGLTLEVADGFLTPAQPATDPESPAGKAKPILERARAAVLLDGEAVWKRSALDEHLERWLTIGAAMGAFGIEVVRRTSDGKAILTLADPRNTRVWFDDETGTEIVKVVTTSSYRDPDAMNERDGVVDIGTPHTYRRELYADRVEVYRDGKPMGAPESGPHNLGRVPFVWLTWKPCPDPEHGFSAAHGVEGALMRADSLMEEIGAIANRYGWPWVVAKGFSVGAGSGVSQFGRILSGVPADGSLDMVVGGADAIGPLLEAVAACVKEIETAPEFIFTEGGAGESGEARSYKASAYEAKVTMARNRLLSGLSRAIWYGTMMDARKAITPEMADVEVYKIDAGPVLPRNLKGETEILTLIKPDLKRGDYVRALQRLGFVDADEDPEEYAAEVADEGAARATAFFEDPNAEKPPVKPVTGPE